MVDRTQKGVPAVVILAGSAVARSALSSFDTDKAPSSPITPGADHRLATGGADGRAAPHISRSMRGRLPSYQALSQKVGSCAGR